MTQPSAVNREWEAFKAFRLSHRRDLLRQWVAVHGDEVLGVFATKDEAVDALLVIEPTLRGCAVFHWEDEPLEVALCVVFNHDHS